MFNWSFLLFPIALMYGLVTFIRNKLYDLNIFKSFQIPVKSIIVGNLSVGGTGKTPHVFFIANLLSSKIETAILSRGYGRKSTGYKEVFNSSQAVEVGDEPLLLKSRLNSIPVIVSESRKLGVKKMIRDFAVKLIVLDDAFQHRKVKAGLNILLTEFHRPYFNDYPLPMGRLREFRIGYKRSNIVIVTKCPSEISEIEKEYFIKKIGIESSRIFFSKIKYSPFISFSKNTITKVKSMLLVTAIADDIKIIQFLSPSYSVKTFKFRDHHSFTEEDIRKIHLKFELLPKEESIILTTEKDYVKLKEYDVVTKGIYPWYFLPIDIEVDRENEFNKLLVDYVGSI